MDVLLWFGLMERVWGLVGAVMKQFTGLSLLIEGRIAVKCEFVLAKVLCRLRTTKKEFVICRRIMF